MPAVGGISHVSPHSPLGLTALAGMGGPAVREAISFTGALSPVSRGHLDTLTVARAAVDDARGAVYRILMRRLEPDGNVRMAGRVFSADDPRIGALADDFSATYENMQRVGNPIDAFEMNIPGGARQMLANLGTDLVIHTADSSGEVLRRLDVNAPVEESLATQRFYDMVGDLVVT